MKEIVLVNNRTSERYRFDDRRALKDLDIKSGDEFQIVYDANVAGREMRL